MSWRSTNRCCRTGVRFKAVVIVLAVLALLGTGLLLIPRPPTEFFPRIDAGNFTMLVEGARRVADREDHSHRGANRSSWCRR